MSLESVHNKRFHIFRGTLLEVIKATATGVDGLSHKNEWENLEWLENARRLVGWIIHRPADERVLLFVRHSHRSTIKEHSAQLSTGLTDLGRKMAKEMGKHLPIHNPAHFFFSFVPRCYETAQEMADGLTEMGGTIRGMDPLPILVMPEYNDETVWKNLQPDGRNVFEFVNRWADGEFGDMIQDFEAYGESLLSDTIVRLSSEKKPVLHIHVTHDLALMTMKRILLQRPLGPEDREPYLGGIGISFEQNNTQHRFFSSLGES